jgi:hypothetical protein
MKLPRWLIVSLITASVLAVLGAGVWWWVTWPERTVRRFFNDWSGDPEVPLEFPSEKLDDIEKDLLEYRIRWYANAITCSDCQLEPLRRTVIDAVVGRAVFKLSGKKEVFVAAERDSMFIDWEVITDPTVAPFPPDAQFSNRGWLLLRYKTMTP